MHERGIYILLYVQLHIAGVSVQRFVANHLRLLGGPSFAGGHDAGTLMTLGVVMVLVVCCAGHTS